MTHRIPAPASQSPIWLQRGSCQEAGQHPSILQRITCYFRGIFIFFFCLKQQGGCVFWTTSVSLVTFFSPDDSYGTSDISLCAAGNKEAGLRKNIGALYQDPPHFFHLYQLVCPPETTSYSTTQWMKSTFEPLPVKCPGAQCVGLSTCLGNKIWDYCKINGDHTMEFLT